MGPNSDASPRDTGTVVLGLPPNWYTSAEIFRLEQDLIFADAWQLAAPRAKLSRPGDRFVSQVAGAPVVITVDRAGKLHALVNACRHRGHPVATDSKNSMTLRCPYHAWVYELDGRLRSATTIAAGDVMRQCDVRLRRVALKASQSFVFIKLTDPRLSKADSGPSEDDVAVLQSPKLDFSGFSFFASSSTCLKANWKSWVENLNECYHCATIHRDSFSQAWDVSQRAYKWVCDDLTIGQFAVANPRSQTGDAPATRSEVYSWPCYVVSVDDHIGLASSIVPVSPSETNLNSYIYIRDGISRRVAKDWIEMYNKTFAEDVEAVERQQESYRTVMAEPGLVVPEYEPGVARFHALVRDALARPRQANG